MKRSIASVVSITVMSIAAGLAAQTAAPTAPPAGHPPGLTLNTTAFDDGGIIPNKYTAAAAPAAALTPPLAWSHVPDGTASFALFLVDPDTLIDGKTDVVLHWMMFNIPGTSTLLPEGIPTLAQLPDGSIQGHARIHTPLKDAGYMGPGAGAAGPYHHYTFILYALNTKLALGPDATQADVEGAMQGHILGKGVLVGRFHRP